MSFQVDGLDHVALGVADPGGEESWYADVSRRAASGAPSRDSNIAFRVDRENFEAAQEDFRTRGIPFEFANHDVAHSIYFEDPAGLRLELTTYEL